jgi:hypothetical protein
MSLLQMLLELAIDLARGQVANDECARRCIAMALATGVSPNILASFLNSESVSRVEARVAAARKK